MAIWRARIGYALPLLFALLLAGAVGTLAPDRARAAVLGSEAQRFVKSVGDRALALLARHNETGDARSRAELKQLLRNSFDLEQGSRFVIGRHWTEATPRQQSALRALLPEYGLEMATRTVFAWRARDVQEFSVVRSRTLDNRDVLVETRVRLGQAEPVVVGWQVRRGDRSMKIVDAVFLGVSLRVVLRDTVDAQIGRHGIDGLIVDIRQKLAALQAED